MLYDTKHLSLSLSIYIYIYIYIGRPPDELGPVSLQASERHKWGQHYWGHCKFHIFDRDFLGTPVNLLVYFPKCQCVPFPPLCQESLLFCNGPISVDPICPQPKAGGPGRRVRGLLVPVAAAHRGARGRGGRGAEGGP